MSIEIIIYYMNITSNFLFVGFVLFCYKPTYVHPLLNYTKN